MNHKWLRTVCLFVEMLPHTPRRENIVVKLCFTFASFKGCSNVMTFCKSDCSYVSFFDYPLWNIVQQQKECSLWSSQLQLSPVSCRTCLIFIEIGIAFQISCIKYQRLQATRAWFRIYQRVGHILRKFATFFLLENMVYVLRYLSQVYNEICSCPVTYCRKLKLKRTSQIVFILVFMFSI